MSPQPFPAVSARQRQLVRESFLSLTEYSESFVLLFYGRLFELSPSLRALFKIDLKLQSRKLMEMLAVIVEGLEHFECLRPRMQELGRRHVGYGALPEHYDILRQALLWAFAQALEGEFDRETRAAWSAVLQAVNTAMLEGASSLA